MKKLILSLLVISGSCVLASNITDQQATEYLFDAVRRNDLEGVKRAIAAGADVDAKDKNNQTPLHYAARYNADKSAAILIQAEAHIPNGFTPSEINFLDAIIRLKINPRINDNAVAIGALCYNTRKNINICLSIAKLLEVDRERTTPFPLVSEIYTQRQGERSAFFREQKRKLQQLEQQERQTIFKQQELERQQIEYLMTILEQAHAAE